MPEDCAKKMDCVGKSEKRHVVCIPFPFQSHINAMLSVAKLLHQRGGFYITFVNTEYSHNRILKTRGPNALDGLPDFQFRTIPDGLPASSAVDDDATKDISALCASISKNLVAPFRNLLSELQDACSRDNNLLPPVSFVIGDRCLPFTIQVVAEFNNVPIAQFWPISGCSVLAYMHYSELVNRGITPFKGMQNIKLRDMPSFIRTTNPQDIFLNFMIQTTVAAPKASAIIINTFDALEHNVLEALSHLLPVPPIYTIGPIHLFEKQIKDQSLKNIATNLWNEESECIDWLNSKQPNSVIYVNFGSLAVVTPHHLTEFAWGLVNSCKPFLWIIRPDLVLGDSSHLASDLSLKVKEIGMIASWCSQKKVMEHPSIGGFLTHSGWNSTIESICAGVPMISWPFFGDQQTNCRFCSVEWGIAMELDTDVKRDEVENLIKELMEGEKREVMKRNIMELKSKAEEACKPGGSSYINVEKFITEILERK